MNGIERGKTAVRKCCWPFLPSGVLICSIWDGSRRAKVSVRQLGYLGVKHNKAISSGAWNGGCRKDARLQIEIRPDI